MASKNTSGNSGKRGYEKKEAVSTTRLADHETYDDPNTMLHAKYAKQESPVVGATGSHEPSSGRSEGSQSSSSSEALGIEIPSGCSAWNGSDISGAILDRLNFHYKYTEGCSMTSLMKKGWEHLILSSRIVPKGGVIEPDPPYLNGGLNRNLPLYEQPFIQQALSQMVCIEDIFRGDGPLWVDHLSASEPCVSYGRELRRFAQELKASYESKYGDFILMDAENIQSRCDILCRHRMEKFIFWMSTLTGGNTYEAYEKGAIYQEMFQKWASLVDVDLRLGNVNDWTFQALGEKRTAIVDLFGHVEFDLDNRCIYAIAEIERPQSGLFSDMSPPARSGSQPPPSFPGEKFAAQLAGEMIAATKLSGLIKQDCERVVKTVYAFLVIGTKVQLVRGEFSEAYLQNFGFKKEECDMGRGKKLSVQDKVQVHITRQFDFMLAEERAEILRTLVTLRAMAAVWKGLKVDEL